MNGFSAMLLLRCFLRSYCVTAAYNPRGLQSTGFTFAIEPALAALYGPGEGLRMARQRYVWRFNSHPFWAPLLLGVFLRIESDIARKHVQPALLDTLKDTTANTFSAIGDSLFQGSLLPAWALTMGCLVVHGFTTAAVVVTLVLFLLTHLFRLVCFIAGLRKGMSILALVRRLQLIDWSTRIKYLNALLLTLFLFWSLPEANVGMWGKTFAYFTLAGLLVWRLRVPRTALLAIAPVLLLVLWAFGHWA